MLLQLPRYVLDDCGRITLDVKQWNTAEYLPSSVKKWPWHLSEGDDFLLQSWDRCDLISCSVRQCNGCAGVDGCVCRKVNANGCVSRRELCQHHFLLLKSNSCFH